MHAAPAQLGREPPPGERQRLGRRARADAEVAARQGRGQPGGQSAARRCLRAVEPPGRRRCRRRQQGFALEAAQPVGKAATEAGRLGRDVADVPGGGGEDQFAAEHPVPGRSSTRQLGREQFSRPRPAAVRAAVPLAAPSPGAEAPQCRLAGLRPPADQADEDRAAVTRPAVAAGHHAGRSPGSAAGQSQDPRAQGSRLAVDPGVRRCGRKQAATAWARSPGRPRRGSGSSRSLRPRIRVRRRPPCFPGAGRTGRAAPDRLPGGERWDAPCQTSHRRVSGCGRTGHGRRSPHPWLGATAGPAGSAAIPYS